MQNRWASGFPTFLNSFYFFHVVLKSAPSIWELNDIPVFLIFILKIDLSRSAIMIWFPRLKATSAYLFICILGMILETEIAGRKWIVFVNTSQSSANNCIRKKDKFIFPIWMFFRQSFKYTIELFKISRKECLFVPTSRGNVYSENYNFLLA